MVMLQRWKSLIEGEWFCYRGGLFNGEGLVMLQSWPVYWRENGHVTVVVANGGRMIMLQKWSLIK